MEPTSAEPSCRVLPQSGRSVGASASFAALAARLASLPSPQDAESSEDDMPSPPTNGNTVFPRARSRRTTRAELVAMGIKVIDFAYESTLPPVKPFVRRQYQPALTRALKREDTEPIDETPSQQSQVPSTMGLERTLTEPVVEPVIPPARMRGFANLEDYSPDEDTTDLAGSQQTRDALHSDSQPPERYSGSQLSEPYIDTPLVTPNGSLQWKMEQDDPMQHIAQEPQNVALQTASHNLPTFASSSSNPDISPSNTTSSTPFPSSPMSASPVRSKRRLPRSPSMTSIGKSRPTKSRRKSYESTAVSTRYPLRNRVAELKSPLFAGFQDPTRVQSLRSHTPGTVPPLTLQTTCGRSIRKSSDTPNARPLRTSPVKRKRQH